MKVKVIKPGKLVRDEEGKILDARSTITLIKTNDVNIIIDTGLRGEEANIIKNLRAESLNPKDIKFVVNSHLHLDHIGNNFLFSNARFIAHKNERPDENFQIIEGD